jgi:hypothetical protein
MNAKNMKSLERELKTLKDELGENYLNLQKIKGQQLKPEIIIAIENQRI